MPQRLVNLDLADDQISTTATALAGTAQLASNNTFTGNNTFSGTTSHSGVASFGSGMDASSAIALLLGAATATGVQVGKAGGNVGLYGAAPVARAAAITAPAATPSTNVTPFGYSQAQADALVTAVRAIIVALQGIGVTL